MEFLNKELEARLSKLEDRHRRAVASIRDISSSIPRLNNHEELKGDWVIASDWHVPYYSPNWVELMMLTAHKMEVDQLLIPGDFFDQRSFAHHLPSAHEQKDGDWELGICGEVLEQVCKCFKRVVLTAGNHDLRIFRMLLGDISFQTTIRMILENKQDNLLISEYPYSIINPVKAKVGGKMEYIDGWRITHPKNYSVITGRVATNLCNKYSMNVLVAHGHHSGRVQSLNGRYTCGDTGGMFDLLKQQYVMYTDTTHPVWNNGFWIIKNNRGYMFDETTDFKEVLK